MKRKAMVIAAVLICIFALPALAEWATVKNYNQGDRLNLRAKPSVSAMSYGKYYSGTAVQVLARDAGNGFSRVRVGLGNGIGELEGYMQTQYLAFGSEQNTVRDERPTVVLRSSDGRRVFIRDYNNGSNMGAVDSGSAVTVLGVGSKMLHVIAGPDTVGFVSSELATPRLSFSKAGSGSTQPASANRYLYVWDPNRRGNRLNLRKEASKNSTALGKYYPGTEAAPTGKMQNGYIEVRVGGVTGWFDSEYLLEWVQTDERPVVTVTSQNAVIRKQPTVQSTGLLRVDRGSRLTVLGVRADNYLHVEINGTCGFIYSDEVTPHISYSR